MRRHDFDPLSFVFGVLFFAGGALMVSGVTNVAPFTDPRVWPIVAIAAGVLFVIPALARARDAEERPAPAVEGDAGDERADEDGASQAKQAAPVSPPPKP
jgi:hypothetical protein